LKRFEEALVIIIYSTNKKLTLFLKESAWDTQLFGEQLDHMKTCSIFRQKDFGQRILELNLKSVPFKVAIEGNDYFLILSGRCGIE